MGYVRDGIGWTIGVRLHGWMEQYQYQYDQYTAQSASPPCSRDNISIQGAPNKILKKGGDHLGFQLANPNLIYGDGLVHQF